MPETTFVETYSNQDLGAGYAYEDTLRQAYYEPSEVESEDGEVDGEDLYSRILSRGQMDPWFETHLRSLGLKIEQVTYNKIAIELLSRLYEEGVLSVSDLGRNVGARRALAMAMLAAAGLCDVDPYSVRIASPGSAMVTRLRDEATGAGE